MIEAAGQVKRCSPYPEPKAHAITFTDTAIILALYFWIEDVVEGRLEPRTQAMLGTLRLFREHGIEIPIAAPSSAAAAAALTKK